MVVGSLFELLLLLLLLEEVGLEVGRGRGGDLGLVLFEDDVEVVWAGPAWVGLPVCSVMLE